MHLNASGVNHAGERFMFPMDALPGLGTTVDVDRERPVVFGCLLILRRSPVRRTDLGPVQIGSRRGSVHVAREKGDGTKDAGKTGTLRLDRPDWRAWVRSTATNR